MHTETGGEFWMCTRHIYGIYTRL